MDGQGRLLSNAAFRLFTLVVLLVLPFNTIAFNSSDQINFSISKVFLPIVFNSITEIEPIPCRWPHSYNQFTTIYYKWGETLQTPGTPWRVAYEAAISDWHWAPTYIYFSYSSTGPVKFDIYYDPNDDDAGHAAITCYGSTTTKVDVSSNTFHDPGNNNIRRAYAGHETGHSQSINHIAQEEGIALMGFNPNPSIYYIPQLTDTSLVNQVYP